LLVISKEKIITEKTKCTTKSKHKIGDTSFQNVANLDIWE